jgi:hypothetical protein
VFAAEISLLLFEPFCPAVRASLLLLVAVAMVANEAKQQRGNSARNNNGIIFLLLLLVSIDRMAGECGVDWQKHLFLSLITVKLLILGKYRHLKF